MLYMWYKLNLYTRIHVCMHTHTCTIHMHAQTHSHMHTHTHIHTCTHTHTHTHTRTHAHTRTHVHTHAYTHTPHTHTTHTHIHITEAAACPSWCTLLVYCSCLGRGSWPSPALPLHWPLKALFSSWHPGALLWHHLDAKELAGRKRGRGKMGLIAWKKRSWGGGGEICCCIHFTVSCTKLEWPCSWICIVANSPFR